MMFVSVFQGLVCSNCGHSERFNRIYTERKREIECVCVAERVADKRERERREERREKGRSCEARVHTQNHTEKEILSISQYCTVEMILIFILIVLS